MSQLASLLLVDLPALVDPPASADLQASKAAVDPQVSVDDKPQKDRYNQVDSAALASRCATEHLRALYTLAHKDAPIEAGS